MRSDGSDSGPLQSLCSSQQGLVVGLQGPQGCLSFLEGKGNHVSMGLFILLQFPLCCQAEKGQATQTWIFGRGIFFFFVQGGDVYCSLGVREKTPCYLGHPEPQAWSCGANPSQMAWDFRDD